MIEILPAVDIRGGRAVRLRQGDYNAETVFDADPVAAARRWVDAGATRLHVVDLDGARDGARDGVPANFALTAAIARLGPPVQTGGGIRDAATVRRCLDAGIARVVLGTAAVHDLALLEQLCEAYGETIVVSLDARDGKVATDGWTATTDVDAIALAQRLADVGVSRFVYTDISRDGMLTEPNYAALERLVQSVDAAVIASGGVADVAQIPRVAATGAEALIIGRALYDGRVDLVEALRVAAGSAE